MATTEQVQEYFQKTAKPSGKIDSRLAQNKVYEYVVDTIKGFKDATDEILDLVCGKLKLPKIPN